MRKHRLAELQAKHGDPGDAAQQEAKQREAEMRNSILAQVLDQSARARLSNLALVKPEKTKAVENYLIQMAWYGQLNGKVSEQGLTEILEKFHLPIGCHTQKPCTQLFGPELLVRHSCARHLGSTAPCRRAAHNTAIQDGGGGPVCGDAVRDTVTWSVSNTPAPDPRELGPAPR
ncbi:hypothetical protein J1605_020198 [Eschrichtius robustus]|uniref:Programmed cell death protein 5 n=1 Tax=Eschrichtius robustus TaxID=9764 RepID=A0AB34HGQ7_ESCRO|nr:hypothetical protein J1605_020198 [Eschrichtius robustus]